MDHQSAPATRTLLDDFASEFGNATRLPVRFHPPGEFSVAADPLVPAFCRIMAEQRVGCRHCVATHLALQDPAAAEARSSTCFAGLTSSAVPVARDGHLLGYLHTGHAYVDRTPGCGNPGAGCYLPGRAKAGLRCAGACRQATRMTAAQYHGALGLIRIFSLQFAPIASHAASRDAYPAIERAVQEIRRDIARKWTLTDLSRRAGMHPTYFSEKFREHVGVPFTAFLARLRVEKARDLLRFTALPITEIAFVSGFGSISQFNRTYRSLLGQSPSNTRLTSADPTNAPRTGSQ